MFIYICLAIGAAVFLAAIALAVSARHNTSKSISFILVGIFFSTFALSLPAVKLDSTILEQSSFDAVYRAIKAMLYSFKSLGGRQEINELYSIIGELGGVSKYIYYGLCYVMFFLAPILSSALILSFFGDFGEKIRYALHFSKKCYVISNLNDTSVSLARGIKSSNRFATVVFCDTKAANKELITKAKRLGGICFYKSCADFHVGFFHKEYEFNLIADNEDENIKYACKILQKNKHIKADKLTVNAFSQSGESIDLVESLNQSNIKLHFIDKVALLCNQIVYKNPLYDIPKENEKNISVAIIGCGRTGLQMLKTAIWCGQVIDHTLKIRVFDSKAKDIENEFLSQAPDLKLDDYNVEFIKTNVFTPQFEKDIASHSLDATFVFVATGDDKLNLQTAVKLRGIFRRKRGETRDTLDMNPKILTRVRDDIITDNIYNSKYLSERNIVAFGNVSNLLEKKVLFETRLEKLALGVHLAYCGIKGTKKEYVDAELKKANLKSKKDKKKKAKSAAADFDNAVAQFYTKEYDRRSSMAAALHIDSKLYSVGLCYDLPDFDKEFNACLDTRLEDLAKNEHDRWNAFFRSEGYFSADLNAIKKYYTVKDNSHKDPYSKYHPCITPWSELDGIMKDYYAFANQEIKKYNSTVADPKNEKALRDPNFNYSKYDRDIIKAIPDILHFAYSKKEAKR